MFQHVCVIQIIQLVKYVIKIMEVVHAKTPPSLLQTEHVDVVLEDMEIFLTAKVKFQYQ